MADPMDVDTDAMSSGICLQNDGKRMLQDDFTITKSEEEDLIELPDPKQSGLSAVRHMDQGVQLSAGPAVKRQRTIIQLPNILGLATRQRKNQRGPEDTDTEQLHLRLQASQAENVALQKKIDELQVELGSVQKANGALEKWNHKGQKDYGTLVDRYHGLEKDLERKKGDHQTEIAQLKARVNDLSRTNDRLRQIIVPVSEKQVLDSDVVARFVSLRASILSLVRQTWKTELKKDVNVRQLSGRQRDFFQSGLPVTYDRLRFMVFKVVYDIILGPERYFLRDDLEQLEQQLRKVEKSLDINLSQEDCAKLLEWRSTTLKATEGLRQISNRFSSATTRKIWNLLAPLQTKSEAAEQTGRAKLEAVCGNAVELSLILRQLKDCFWVDHLAHAQGAHISGWGKVADDIESVRAGTSHPTGTILYVITGALVKRPKENFKRVLVLEKAEVAVVE